MAFQNHPQAVRAEANDLSGWLHDWKVVRSDSMDIKNDPRFFTDNVLDKRLAAFGCLGVVSGLMVHNAMFHAFEMRKDMDIMTYDGVFQLVGFTLLCGVLYGNVLSTYVGVVQPYHTYRLMTAGPTGFETACAYYLHKDIISWRHFSIKLMLISMPIFIISSGLRFIVKFDRDMSKGVALMQEPPLWARLEGVFCCVAFTLIALGLFHIHWRHEEVFRLMYEAIVQTSGVSNIMTAVDTMSNRNLRGRMGLDV